MKVIRLYIFFLFAFLAAGQAVRATDKTVSYRITGATQNGSSYTLTFGLADGSGTPFDNSATYNTITVNTLTATDQTVTLGDGFSLRLQWEAGTDVIICDGGYGWNINTTSGYVTYTVASSSVKYFVTHLDMQNNVGDTWMTDTDSNPIMPDFNYAYQLSKSYNSKQIFGRLVVKYTDTPPLSALTNPSTGTYNITSKRDLAVLAAHVNNGTVNNCSGLTFNQTGDITCDNNYTPIGNSSHPFCGSYDGGGFLVSGITVNRTGTSDSDKCIGLFGCLSTGGLVQNLRVGSSSFSGQENVGGIVGKNAGGTVRNCRVEANVSVLAGSASAKYFGGIVGLNDGGTVEGCVSAAAVSDNGLETCSYFGGIIGYCSIGSSLKNSLYTGNYVTSTSSKGALIGYRKSDNSTYANNYYTSNSVPGGVNNGDNNGLCRARTVTLGTGVILVGDETAYNLNGITAIGTGSYALRWGNTLYSGEGQTLTLNNACAPAPEGYHIGYSYNDGTQDYVLPANTLIMPAADVSVKTIGNTPNTYYVQFKANGGSGTMENQAFTYDAPQALTANAFSRTGYIFSGWNTAYNGSGVPYQDQQIVKNLTTVDGETVTLYAQWADDLPFYWHADADHDGSTAEKAYIISTTEGLALLARLVFQGNHYSGTYFELGADITYSYQNLPANASNYTAIGSSDYPFNGVFDGKNFTISGIRIREDSNYQGLFGYLGGTVKNITLADAEIKSTSQRIGGIAGYVNGGIIDGCIVSKIEIEGYNSCGGIAGGATNKSTISNCLVLDFAAKTEFWPGVIVGNGGTFRNNYYYNCTCTCSNTIRKINVGTGSGDAEGARAAIRFDSLPDRIGTQTATYLNGLTVFENGFAYKGYYYLDNRLDGTSDVNLTLTRGTMAGITAWWGTYYDKTLRFTLPEGAQAFTMDSNRHLYRLGDDGRVIPANTAVIILSDRQNITLTVDGGTTAITDHSGGNILKGSNYDNNMTNTYVMGIVDGTISFFMKHNDIIPAHKAYYSE